MLIIIIPFYDGKLRHERDSLTSTRSQLISELQYLNPSSLAAESIFLTPTLFCSYAGKKTEAQRRKMVHLPRTAFKAV